MAELFASALLLVKGAVLHGVVSRTRACPQTFAARFGVLHAYRSYDELLQDSAIEIVYVATRNEHHQIDSLAAINSGKAVLCEKPFALSASEGRAVVEAARRRGVFCMEAMWMRCSPALREVLDIIRGGKLGDPRLVSAQLGFPIQFDPLHRVFVKPGGGALFDLGVYPLSFTHALLGRPIRISSLACVGATGVDDQFAAVLEYQSGCQAVIAASLRTHLANSAAIHATNGTLVDIGPLYFPAAYQVTTTVSNASPRSEPRGQLSRLSQRAWARIGRHLRSRGHTGTVTRHSIANGYVCEAAVVQTCLQRGLLESPEMPLDGTIEVLESMDTIRNIWSEAL